MYILYIIPIHIYYAHSFVDVCTYAHTGMQQRFYSYFTLAFDLNNYTYMYTYCIIAYYRLMLPLSPVQMMIHQQVVVVAHRISLRSQCSDSCAQGNHWLNPGTSCPPLPSHGFRRREFRVFHARNIPIMCNVVVM